MKLFAGKHREGKFSDQELLSMIRAGGREENRAHDDLSRYLRPQIIAWVRRRGGGQQDGEDVFQDAVITLDQSLRKGRFGGQEKVRAFIWDVARKAWYMRCRKREREAELPDAYDAADPGAHGWLVEMLHDELHRREILALFDRACPNCKELLERQFYQNYSNEALADHLGQKVSSVQVKRSRCVHALRRHLIAHPEDMQLFQIALPTLNPQ